MSVATSRSSKLVKIPMGADVDIVYHDPGTVYNCEIHLAKAPSGYVAVAARMPSLIAGGSTEDEAKAAIREKLAAWLKSQSASGSIRWADAKRECEPGEVARIITVEVR